MWKIKSEVMMKKYTAVQCGNWDVICFEGEIPAGEVRGGYAVAFVSAKFGKGFRPNGPKI